MANNVFANNMEISCKAADGKSICAFPDVCMTPPENPATPPGVPIPYPNTGMASDTTDGSSTVKISSNEVMLKNKSYFKKSTGDEAGCAAKKGVVTSKNMGKIYFTMWSMDVKVEGENVVRHFDLSTHNHGSIPGNTLPWLYTDTMDVSQIPDDCKKQANDFNDKCGKHIKTHPDGTLNKAGSNAAMCDESDGGACKKARKCILTPFNLGCCDDQTAHHIVPKAQFKEKGKGGAPLLTDDDGQDKYKPNEAPCICLDGHSHYTKDHGKAHRTTNRKTKVKLGVPSDESIPADARWDLGDAEEVGAEAIEEVTDDPKCKKECTQAQLRKGHENMELSADDQVRPSTAGKHIEPQDTTTYD